MQILLVISDPSYGTERAYNGVRLANSLKKRDDDEVVEGTRPSTLDEPTDWTLWVDKGLVL